MNRSQAIEAGSKTYIGNPCKCGCNEKYVSSYGCIACTLARNDKEYIKKYSKSDKAKLRSKEYVEKIKQDGKISEYNVKWRNGTGKGHAKEYYDNNKDIWKDRQLKRTYNITLEQYNKLLQEQNHCCNICGAHESNFKKSLAVDHCHNTGVVRGLLCKNCNTGIGNFYDNVDIMKRAIEYIMRYKC